MIRRSFALRRLSSWFWPRPSRLAEICSRRSSAGLRPARRSRPADARLQPRSCSATAVQHGPTSIAAGRCWTKANPIGPLPTPPRPSRLDPNMAIAYVNRAAALLGKGENDRVIADTTKAIALDPKLAIAYVNRAHAYINKGQLRPRHRRVRCRHQARSEYGSCLQRPRLGLSQQGRLRSGHHRLQRGPPYQPEICHRPTQPQRRLLQQGRLRPCHRRCQRSDPHDPRSTFALQQPRPGAQEQGRP